MLWALTEEGSATCGSSRDRGARATGCVFVQGMVAKRIRVPAEPWGAEGHMWKVCTIWWRSTGNQDGEVGGEGTGAMLGGRGTQTQKSNLGSFPREETPQQVP